MNSWGKVDPEPHLSQGIKVQLTGLSIECQINRTDYADLLCGGGGAGERGGTHLEKNRSSPPSSPPSPPPSPPSPSSPPLIIASQGHISDVTVIFEFSNGCLKFGLKNSLQIL